MSRWNPARWKPIGTNSAGDPMYARTNTAAARDYSEMTKTELQDLLESMELPKTGTKDELVARLQEAG